MAVCTINRIRLRKLVIFGMVLQIVVFSMYMTVFQSEHDTQRSRTLGQPLHFTQAINTPATANRSSGTMCPGGDKTCLSERFDKVSSSCTGLVFPYHLMKQNAWQIIDSGRNGYVFSAYYDREKLKMLGVTSAKLGPVTCQLWYSTNTPNVVEMVQVAATVAGIPEGHGKRFTAAYFTCAIPENRKSTAPLAVSVVKEKCSSPENVVPVTVTRDLITKDRFTVCVTPFNFRYGRAYELIEWIELNRILGADRFVFYNYSVASNVESVLQSYINQGIVEVVNWKLPMGVAKWPPTKGSEEIHYFGQLGSLNECLLRNRGRSEYVVNLDIDEFIIPRKKDVKSWPDMLASQPDGSGYVFANVFFRKEWNTSKTNFSRYEFAKRFKLVTLLQLQHEKTVNNYQMRSKYMVKPYSVEVLGIHNVWKHSSKLVNVPHDVALLHHYRNWLRYSDKQARIDDETIVQKFKDALIDNVVAQWNNLPDVEMDIPLCDNPKDYSAC